MAKYIDAERFVEYFGDWYTEEGTESGFIGTVKDLVEQMPAADVERHGRWVKVDDNPYEYVAVCSVCRNEVKQPTCMLKPIYSYCPICGARMSGEQEKRQ